MSLPVVAVVGRPNVGKSTFFNRVLGKRVAIVDDRPGVTRDRNFAKAEWAGRSFIVVDTGGILEASDEPMDRLVREQALRAVEEADVLLLVVDGKAGVHPLDGRLADLLRKTQKPVLVVVNKLDNLPNDPSYHDFWELGLGEPVPVSAISGKGSGDLLDKVIAQFPEAGEPLDDPNTVRVAVVGKPNVGKSSLINRLFNEERVVVSEVAGTTRDPVDSLMKYSGKDLIFVDTAGLRRQSRVKDNVEYYSAVRTARVVEEADVCVVLIDATEDVHHQDLRVIEQAWEAGAGVCILVNKWDLVEKETNTAADFERVARERAPFLRWIPFVFVSALTGQRVRKVLDLILEIQEERHRRIATAEVNEVLRRLVHRQPPPHFRGREVKIKYATQVTVAPPRFALFANLPKGLPAHYIRYIENGFREAWGFHGTDLRLQIRESSTSSPYS
ncbi:MAG TPA: ribosome biogenesis GTPase Der [Longimicrobiales bacterium]|nr:ribosome biogenesis GTPase Der [Longimicrobiales bacterium]